MNNPTKITINKNTIYKIFEYLYYESEGYSARDAKRIMTFIDLFLKIDDPNYLELLKIVRDYDDDDDGGTCNDAHYLFYILYRKTRGPNFDVSIIDN